MGHEADERRGGDPGEPGEPGGGPRARGMALAVLVLGLLQLASVARIGPVDDDYIVYRYAENLLAGDGWAFNAGGDEVEGFTSPLWLAIVALGLAVGAAPGLWSPGIGVLSFALAALMAWRLGGALRRAGLIRPRWAPVPALLVVLSPALGWHAMQGLGTLPLAAAIAVFVERLLAWWIGGERRALYAGMLALGLATALRIESVALLLPWLIAAAARGRREVLRSALIPIAVSVAITAWRRATFGEWVPNTYHVKTLPLAEELSYGSRYLIDAAGEGALSVWLLLATMLLGGPRPSEARSIGGPIPVGTLFGGMGLIALLLALLVGGDWMPFGRFLVPFAVPAAAGATIVLSGLGAVGAGGAFALIALTVFGFTARPQAAFEHRFFEAWWLRVGERLAAGAPADARVGLSPIGAIGWRSKLGVVDVLGLTHASFREVPPDLERVSVKGHHRFDGEWVLGQAPEYLLLGNAVLQPDTGSLDVNPWERDIVESRSFKARYVADQIEIEGPGGEAQVLPYFRLRSAPRIR